MICKLAEISEIHDGEWYEFSLHTNELMISIMLIKHDESYIAYENLCPHQNRRMDYSAGKFLISKLGNIICPAHGAEFNFANGLCINGPCLGQSLKPIHIQLNEKTVFAII